MSTKSHRIEVSGITVEVVRKAIKNLHIGVYPPEGRVRVAAPSRMNMDAVRLAVVGKLGWIRKHQAKFAGQERHSQREYVTGESHYVQGRRYRLDVIYHDAPPTVSIGPGGLTLQVRTGSEREQREQVLQTWYRQQLKAQLPALLAKWEEIIGVQVAEWGVKRMKTRWGTCNIEARRIWVNLELARKPLHCLEYLVVHELVHLLERHHNGRFRLLMDRFLPQWQAYRKELNHSPLAHEEWEY